MPAGDHRRGGSPSQSSSFVQHWTAGSCGHAASGRRPAGGAPRRCAERRTAFFLVSRRRAAAEWPRHPPDRQPQLPRRCRPTQRRPASAPAPRHAELLTTTAHTQHRAARSPAQRITAQPHLDALQLVEREHARPRLAHARGLVCAERCLVPRQVERAQASAAVVAAVGAALCGEWRLGQHGARVADIAHCHVAPLHSTRGRALQRSSACRSSAGLGGSRTGGKGGGVRRQWRALGGRSWSAGGC
jgi:hypothetical protein